MQWSDCPFLVAGWQCSKAGMPSDSLIGKLAAMLFSAGGLPDRRASCGKVELPVEAMHSWTVTHCLRAMEAGPSAGADLITTCEAQSTFVIYGGLPACRNAELLSGWTAGACLHAVKICFAYLAWGSCAAILPCSSGEAIGKEKPMVYHDKSLESAMDEGMTAFRECHLNP